MKIIHCIHHFSQYPLMQNSRISNGVIIGSFITYTTFNSVAAPTKLLTLQLSIHTHTGLFGSHPDDYKAKSNSTTRSKLDLTQYATSFTSALLTVSSRFWPAIAAELRQQDFRRRSRSRCLPHLSLLNQSISACMLSTERYPNRKKHNITSRISIAGTF